MTTKLRLTSERAFRAVFRKDRQYDGQFVYAAVTTGIYCRPSCPARNPRRRNILIFPAAGEAEQQGYAACRRCHPNSLAPAEKSIQAALDFIEEHSDQTITLKALSRVAHLSPHYLQEIFKRVVGLSPKAFCDARRAVRFRELLRCGRPIAAACYEAGYGSSRALYETTRKTMGMTPSIYRRGGEGVDIRYAVASAAQTSVLIARTALGPCSVLWDEHEERLTDDLRCEFPKANLRRESPARWERVVRSCQVDDPLLSRLPVRLQGRIFLARIWNTIAAGSR